MFLSGLFGGKKPKDKKEELKELIRQGILYEEEFIIMYAKLLKGERFSPYFKDQHKEKVKQHLDVLLVESEFHKKGMEQILNNLK